MRSASARSASRTRTAFGTPRLAWTRPSSRSAFSRSRSAKARWNAGSEKKISARVASPNAGCICDTSKWTCFASSPGAGGAATEKNSQRWNSNPPADGSFATVMLPGVWSRNM